MTEDVIRRKYGTLNDPGPSAWDKAAAKSRQVGGCHYKDLAIQPIDYIMKNEMAYCAANIIKYATRAELKGGIQDIDKIIHYAELWRENYS